MFTFGALFFALIIAWFANRANEKERNNYDTARDDGRTWMLLLHLRQDMKILCFLAFGIIIMLGVIADRIH